MIWYDGSVCVYAMIFVFNFFSIAFEKWVDF